jgi:hypothetical protein
MKELLCLLSAILAMTAQSGTCWAFPQREAKPRFKGVDLYSWKGDGGDWIFALLDGTNESKIREEVKATKTPIKGVEELKKALACLAEDEHVFWTHMIEGFEFPPEAMQKEIEEAAKRSKVELRIDRREPPPQREAKPRFKGVELYSWRDKEGNWVFALLNGTNRLKTRDEVKAPKISIKGVKELKTALARLAEDEHVFWTHLIEGFEFPPEAMQKEIAEAAKGAKIELLIERHKE